jgi:signal transduction histidine kinase
LHKKDGKEFWGIVRLASMCDVKGKWLCLVTMNDITERKKAEEAQLALMKAKSDFTSMVTHELRFPIAVIKMGLDFIFIESTDNLNKNQLEILTSSRNCINRLKRLINSTLDLQKLNSGTIFLIYRSMTSTMSYGK